MANSKKATESKKSSKKIEREAIEKKIETALAAFKPMADDKSFKSLIKKAGKLFSHGIKKQHGAEAVKVSVEKKEPVAVKKVKK